MKNRLLNFFNNNCYLKDGLFHLGGMTIMLMKSIGFILQGRVDIHETITQMKRIGNDSLPMVSITALATGMVLVVQMGNQFAKMGAESYVGGVVALAQARELAPILTAIVVAGRIGSAMTAEIGTMKVTEQIDALETLAVSPVRYLVVPRLLAGVVMLPFLTIYANLIGIAGGLFVAVAQINMSIVSFRESVVSQLMINDIVGGLIKALAFGLIISLVGCYRGFITKGGAEGVGASTTGSVVTAIMLIFVSNYFLSVLIVNFVEAFLY